MERGGGGGVEGGYGCDMKENSWKSMGDKGRNIRCGEETEEARWRATMFGGENENS